MLDAKVFLASLLHVSMDDLEKALMETEMYRRAYTPKRGSGKRVLFIPPSNLRFVQERILGEFFTAFHYRTYSTVIGGNALSLQMQNAIFQTEEDTG